MALTLKEFWRKPVTLNYPFETQPLSPRYRAVHNLQRMLESGSERCIGCGLCEKICTSNCIRILTHEGEDGRKKIDSYTINLGRCIYCGFYSTTLMDLRHQYVDAVCAEMRLRRDYISGPYSTIYVGGGTPSTLDVMDLKKLFDNIYKVFSVETDAEVTIECNPDDVTPSFVDLLAGLPVNRVSIGVQTFSDGRLKLLRRRHDAAEIYQAVDNLRRGGISNISVDLIFGFPCETLTDWIYDIESALSLNVEHISAYSLMYDELVSRLGRAGFEHYEISNFARSGFRSRHNSSYWRQIPYIGLGAAAHSFDLCSRQWNVSNVASYISAIDCESVPMEREELDSNTIFNDIITTALRTSEGIDLKWLDLTLGQSYCNILLDNASRYLSEGLLVLDNGCLHLTYRGIFVSDMVMGDLVIV